MAFVEDQFIPDGVYNIVNAEHPRSIIRGHDSQDRLTASSNDNHIWLITALADKKWQIRSQTSGDYPDIELEADEGDEIPLRTAQGKPHSWVIKQCSATPDSYLIYSPSEPGLFWGLSDTKEGAALTLSCNHRSPSSQWKFQDLTDPGNPAPGTTNPGFNDTLDLPRPNTMADYMTNYDIVFIVDDSSSMRGTRWAEVRLALTELSKEAMRYHADGMEICFLNSKKHEDHIDNPVDVLAIFDTVQPRGWTYTGAKLKIFLNRAIKKLDDAIGKPEYADIKPVDIIVLTDGAPTDDPAVVIADTIERLDSKRHHLNAVGIQFVQIGNEDGAETALQRLRNCPLRRMVETVPYTKALTPQRLSEVLLGTLHPSIRSAIAEKMSTAVRECPICRSDDIPIYEYPRFPPTRRCQHKPLACRECIARHVEVQLSYQTIVLEISCPSSPCLEKLGYDEIKQWATSDCFQRYNSLALRQRLSEEPNFRWCLNVTCDHGQTHLHGDASPIVQCSYCYKKSCFTHQLPWHEGLTCEEFNSLRPELAVDQEAARRLISSTTQQCTKCKKRIERSAGCDHMTCRCGHQLYVSIRFASRGKSHYLTLSFSKLLAMWCDHIPQWASRKPPPTSLSVEAMNEWILLIKGVSL